MIAVVGTGKLARELVSGLPALVSGEVAAWPEARSAGGRQIVVHAGSGRELKGVLAFCAATGSALVELATGSMAAGRDLPFSVVLCPNTNILMLKFMAMLQASGHHFSGCTVRLLESHQADKTSVPGTAVALARSLGLPEAEIVSVRDPRTQEQELGIPAQSLARHAFHRIVIEDGAGSILLETRVTGSQPYAPGVARIVEAVRANRLEPRRYDIMEFVANGWV